MIRWITFSVIIISLILGFYSIILLYRLRKRFSLDFLNSFFYFQVFVFVFGVYGILGNLAVREFLLSFEIEKKSIEITAQVLPFFGIPFIVAAWYLSLKMAGEIVQKKIPGFIAVGYFTLCTAAFLLYWITIKQIGTIEGVGIVDFRRQVEIGFYCIETGIVAYIFIFLLTHLSKKREKKYRQFIWYFSSIFLLSTLLTAVSLHFIDLHFLFPMYFILLYFAGDLPLVILTKNYTEKHLDLHSGKVDKMENLFQEYGISKREREIIYKIKEGKTNKEIAAELYISLQTVKDHNYNIYKKAGVKNRVQLTQKFFQSEDYQG